MATTPISTDVETLRLRSKRRQTRLLFFVVALIGCGIAFYLSSSLNWYAFEFDGLIRANRLSPSVQFQTSGEFDANGVTSTVVDTAAGSTLVSGATAFGVPSFIMFAIVGAFIATVGSFIGSAVCTLLSLPFYIYTWSKFVPIVDEANQLATVDGWQIVPGNGTSVFAAAFGIALICSILASSAALSFKRADRAWRTADGQAVEPTMMQYLATLFNRGAALIKTAQTATVADGAGS